MFASQADSDSASKSSALWWVFEAIKAAVMMTERPFDAHRAMAVPSPANSARQPLH